MVSSLFSCPELLEGFYRALGNGIKFWAAPLGPSALLRGADQRERAA